MQKSKRARDAVLFGTISLLAVVSMYALPSSAHAQVLNPVTSCGAPIIGEFTPHVYDGHLDSFDYYVQNQPGAAYLPLATAINGTQIDLSYVSVWRNVGTDRVKVHVDVPTGKLGGTVTIGISVLQITQGPPPLCPTAATFHVNLPGEASVEVPSVPSTTAGSSSSDIPSAPSRPAPVQPQQAETPVASTTATSTATTSAQENGGGQCTTLSGWWFLVLVLLDIIVSVTLLFFMSIIVKTNGRLIAAVLVPPLVFLALWYFLNTCHTYVWFPILAVLLGIAILTGSGSPEVFDEWRNRVRGFFAKLTTKPVTTIAVINKNTVVEVKK